MSTTKLRRSHPIPQSFNRYAYTQNDPVNFTDPSGLDSCFTPPNAGQAVCHPDPMIGVGNGGSMIGSISPDMRAGESQYDQRVANAYAGYGFVTSAQVIRSFGGDVNELCLSGGCWYDGMGTISTGASLAWHERNGMGFQLEAFANGVSGGLVNLIHRKMGRIGAEGEEWLESQSDYKNAGTAGVVAGMIVPLPVSKLKLLAQFNSVESLIASAGKLTRIKGGKLGAIQGSANDVFNGLARQYQARVGVTDSGRRFFQSGNTRVTLYPSTSTGGIPTLQINTGSQIFKIRITP